MTVVRAAALIALLSIGIAGNASARTPTPTATSTPSVAATPSAQQAARFRGHAWVNANASTADVSAKIGDVVCGNAIWQPVADDGTVYRLTVVSDDIKPGCGREGAVITFLVGGQPAHQTAIWHAGATENALNLLVGSPFASFAGTLQEDEGAQGANLEPFVGGNLCGHGSQSRGISITLGYGATVFSAEQQAGCGVEGAEVIFKLVDAQGNVIGVAKEKGTWHAWDGVSAPQQLNLTMVPVGSTGIKLGSVGTGGSQESGASVWASLSLVLLSIGVLGLVAGVALRRRVIR